MIFDFDGTIADTETVEFESVERVWNDHGLSYGIERWSQIVGQSWAPGWVNDLHDQLRARGEVPPSVDDLHRLQHDRKLVLLDALAPRPGIVELLDAAAHNGVPVGIASNSPLRWVESRLDQLGLRDRFGVLSTIDIASRPKPDPAPYREACEALGARPAFSVAFEDSTTGTASAVAAGLFTVACAGPLTRGHDLGAAHLVVDSHAALSLVTLTGRFEAHVSALS